MFLIKLAIKNLTRHKRRTIITSFALAYGLLMFIIIDSMIVGVFEQSNVNLKDAETGDGKIIRIEAFDDQKFLPLSNRVENPESIIKVAEESGARTSIRVNANGEAIYTEEYFPKEGSTPILFTAVDLNSDNNVFNIFKERHLIAGRFLEMGTDEAVIGSWLAEDIGAEIGDVMTLSVKTASIGSDPGYFQTIDVEIVGIVKVESPMVNRRVVYFPMDSADYYLDLEGSVTEVSLRIPVTMNLEKFKEEINSALPEGYGFYTWRDLSQDYLALTEAKSGGSAVIIFLVIIIAMVGITNTMLMTINERQRELGMMRALGMSDRDIRKAFIIEAAGIGLIGSIVGVILGILGNIPLVNVGIDYSMWLRDIDMGYRVGGYIKGIWNLRTIIAAFILGIIIPMAVAIIPTRRAIKKSIPDCINER